MAPVNAERPAAATAASNARAMTGRAPNMGPVFDVDTRIEQLGIIARWREDLTRRVRQAQLRFELIGLDRKEDERLKAEVDDYVRCCRALMWRPAA
jgi:hypothetical protein